MENFGIDINKDFGRFKNNFFIGFTLQEFLCIIAALIICAVIILPLAFIFHVDLMIAGYLGMGPAVVIIYCGFYEKAGLTFVEYRQKTKALKEMKKLHYESEESMETLMLIMEEEQAEAQKRLQELDASGKKKIKRKKVFKIAVCTIGLLAVFAMAAVFAFHGVKKAVKNREISNGKKEQMAEQMKKSAAETETAASSTAVTTTAEEKRVKTTVTTEQKSVTKANASEEKSAVEKPSQKTYETTVTSRQKQKTAVSSGTRQKKKSDKTKTTAKKKKTSPSTTAKRKTTESTKKENNEFQVDYNTN